MMLHKYELRGRNAYDHPFFDVVFVERDAQGYALSSHIFPQAQRLADLSALLPAIRQRYVAAGFSQLRYRLIWEDGLPIEPSATWHPC